jgi:hypothetical protein
MKKTILFKDNWLLQCNLISFKKLCKKYQIQLNDINNDIEVPN